MEREELLQNVQNEIEADGKKLSPSISEETINAELDDELENIGEDEEANKKVYSRIAKRLLRMDGNIHSNVSREVADYKKKTKSQHADKKDDKTEDNDEMPAWAKAFTDRLDAIEKSRQQSADKAAKDAAEEAVKNGLRAKFKNASVEVNEYIYKQTLRDLEIPETEEGQRIDTESLISQMERAYYRNLKAAGLDKRDTQTPRYGGKGGSKGESSADRFFARKGKKEGWKKD